MESNQPPATPDSELLAQLAELRREHRELDAEIHQADTVPPDDELLIRRLKKRKLLLKDQIAQLESRLDPDEYA